jgi:hypothetical protein
MLVTLYGMVKLVRAVQPLKAPSPMLLTLFGMVTLARLVQLLKAPSPMLVTLSGMVTLSKISPENALSSDNASVAYAINCKRCQKTE